LRLVDLYLIVFIELIFLFQANPSEIQNFFKNNFYQAILDISNIINNLLTILFSSIIFKMLRLSLIFKKIDFILN